MSAGPDETKPTTSVETPPANPPPARKKKSKGRGKKKGTRGAVPETHGSLPAWPLALAAVVLLGLTVWAWPPRPAPESHVKRGNTLYARGQYPEALGEYESAPGAGTRYAGVQLDRGIARYRVTLPPPDGGGIPMMAADAAAPEGLTNAQEELRTAARGGTTGAAEDVEASLRSAAAYDLANTMFSQHDWDHAIDTYKEALRLRPSWRDAAWNLELARRLREAERNPPDAGQDSGQDAAEDASQDASPDAGPQDAAHDGSNPSDSSTSPDGSNGRGDSGQASDSGRGQPDSGGTPDAGNNSNADGGSNESDASTQPRDAAPPRSMAPLDDLDRSSRSLQFELMRRRNSGAPRGPDDDR